jgi:hypothetical protein
MRITFGRALRTSALSALLISVAGCDGDSATIEYAQVGACNGYQQTSGPGGSGPINTVSVGPNRAYVVFRVVQIRNTNSKIDLHFDPARLFVSSGGAHIDPSLAFAKDLGVFTAVPITVQAGKTTGINGLGVAVVSTGAANGASEANTINYMLSYDTPAGEPGIFLEKKNASQTSFPQTDNCRAMTL